MYQEHLRGEIIDIISNEASKQWISHFAVWRMHFFSKEAEGGAHHMTFTYAVMITKEFYTWGLYNYVCVQCEWGSLNIKEKRHDRLHVCKTATHHSNQLTRDCTICASWQGAVVACMHVYRCNIRRCYLNLLPSNGVTRCQLTMLLVSLG